MYRVKFAVHKETKENYAIKILDKEKVQQQNMGAQLRKEIGIMKMVHHEHIVAVQDVFATQKKIFIVLELVEGGELFDKIASEGKFSEGLARFYFKQLVDGLCYCHGLGICHRDLKPENLLLDRKGNLKISDFGVSTLSVGDADAEGEGRAEVSSCKAVMLLLFQEKKCIKCTLYVYVYSYCALLVVHRTMLLQRCWPIRDMMVKWQMCGVLELFYMYCWPDICHSRKQRWWLYLRKLKMPSLLTPLGLRRM